MRMFDVIGLVTKPKTARGAYYTTCFNDAIMKARIDELSWVIDMLETCEFEEETK